MNGNIKNFGPRGFKKSWWASCQTPDKEEVSNICRSCGEWAAELDKDGCCREDACIKHRNNAAIKSGRAFRYWDGLSGGKTIIESKGRVYRAK